MGSADGLALIEARIRRPDVLEDFWFHYENIPGEPVKSTRYPITRSDVERYALPTSRKSVPIPKIRNARHRVA